MWLNEMPYELGPEPTPRSDLDLDQSLVVDIDTKPPVTGEPPLLVV
jgi:hypothetical protein